MKNLRQLYKLENLFKKNHLSSAAAKLSAFIELQQEDSLSEDRLLSLNNIIFGELSESANILVCTDSSDSYANFLFTLSFRAALRGNSSEILKTGKLLIDICGSYDAEKLCSRSILKCALTDWRESRNIDSIRTQYVESSDSLDLALAEWDKPMHIFKTGYLVTPQIVELSKQLSLYPEEPLLRLASDVSDSFLRSFSLADRGREKPSNGSVIRLIYRPGYERILFMIKKRLKKAGYNVLVVPPFASPPESGIVFGFFQNFYMELLDEDLCAFDYECFKKAVVMYNEELGRNCGFIDIISFTQRYKKPNIRLGLIPSNESLKRFAGLDARKVGLLKRYLDPTKTSFCYFPLPRPSCGDDFKGLLSEVLKVNSGENWVGEDVQERLIKDMDRGEAVLIEGRDGNETSLVIVLADLGGNEDCKKTNFNNTGMARNIPAGEIFTTPVLSGTKGLFHLKSFYFQGHHFKNLRFSFKDGMITSFGCDSGSELVRNILLGGHESLPIGELGIGTNAGAYKLIRNFALYESAPILITEKTSPHIAIGDSCYARLATPVYNEYSGREIVLASNNPELYNLHIDMALPFSETGKLSVRLAGGEEFIIIQNGAYRPDYMRDLNRYIS